jgi:hypothetical protein
MKNYVSRPSGLITVCPAISLAIGHPSLQMTLTSEESDMSTTAPYGNGGASTIGGLFQAPVVKEIRVVLAQQSLTLQKKSNVSHPARPYPAGLRALR